MNIKIYNRSLALVSLVIVILTIIMDSFWLLNLTYCLYLISGFLLLRKTGSLKGPFIYGFFIFSLAGNFNSLLEIYSFQPQVTLILYGLAILCLVIEVFKFISIKNARVYILVYFFAIAAVNFYFLSQHVYEIASKLESNISSTVYVIYYINLFILGIVALIYYLNSYSRKSMYFATLSVMIIFYNVLNDMQIFYLQDVGVEVADAIMAVFAIFFSISFFDTPEKKLQLVNFI